MTLAVLGILGTLLGFGARWAYRRWQRADDPLTQHRRAYEQIDREIISRASESISLGGSRDLDELERRLRKSAGSHHTVK